MSRTILCLALLINLISGASRQVRAQLAPPLPDANNLTILVRTTIIALNHANRTGNYSVFRDIASPAFHKSNTPATLAGIYAVLRAQKLDLSPIVLFNPKFTQKPAVNKQGRLRLTGYFPTDPMRVYFDIIYQWVEQRWQLFGISVQTRQAKNAVKKPLGK